MDKAFDYGDLFGRAWEIFRQNAVTMVIVTLLAGGFALLVTSLAGQISTRLDNLVPVLITGPLSVGFFLMSLRAARGRKVGFGDFTEAFPLAGQSIVLHIIFTVFATIGFIICVLPMFFVIALYLPVYLFLIEDRRGFWHAMESSRKFVLDNFLPWLLLAFIYIALNIVGLVLCLVGSLVTFPVSTLMVVLAYDQQRNARFATADTDEPAPPAM